MITEVNGDKLAELIAERDRLLKSNMELQRDKARLEWSFKYGPFKNRGYIDIARAAMEETK